MDASLARKAGLRAPIFLAGLGVDDAEMLRIGAARFGEEVMAVAMVEPDLVAAVLIAQDMNDVAVVQIDDHRRWHVFERVVAAEQDLVLRADRHALRSFALVMRDVEGLDDL